MTAIVICRYSLWFLSSINIFFFYFMNQQKKIDKIKKIWKILSNEAFLPHWLQNCFVEQIIFRHCGALSFYCVAPHPKLSYTYFFICLTIYSILFPLKLLYLKTSRRWKKKKYIFILFFCFVYLFFALIIIVIIITNY